MRCAVVGDPVEHSLSPVLHHAAYDRLGLAWTYDAVRVPAGGLVGAVERLRADDTVPAWRGLSVTAPLKREALALADRVTDRARLAGGANTLVLTGDGVHADNTDLPGAAAAVRERHDGAVRDVVVLGAGATAASVLLALCDLGARRVTLLARDPARAAATVEAVRGHPDGPEVRVLGLDAEPWAADVVVGTVPAAAQEPRTVRAWSGASLVFEAVYDPWPTPLASAVLARRGTLVSGLDLLAHQAVLQVRAFTGLDVDVDLLRDAGGRALEARAALP